VKGAIDDVVLGNLTGLLARIKPARAATRFEGEMSSKNAAYVLNDFKPSEIHEV
jgi:carbonic anhydrase